MAIYGIYDAIDATCGIKNAICGIKNSIYGIINEIFLMPLMPFMESTMQ